MNSTRMIWHLTTFDVLRMRWWWIAYVTALMLSLLPAAGTGYLGGDEIVKAITALALQVVVIVFAVELAQVDGPYNRHAFLQSKPVPRLGFALSKLFASAAFIVLAATTTMVGLISTGLDLAEAIQLLPRPVLFHALTILLGLMAGVSTRTVPAALLMLLGIVPLMFLVGEFVGPRIPLSLQGAVPTGLGAATAIIGSGAFLLVVLYLRAPQVLYARLLTMLIGVAGFTATCGNVQKATPRSTSVPTPSISEGIVFDSATLEPLGQPQLRFTIDGARNDRRYEVRDAKLSLYGGRVVNGVAIRDTVNRLPRATVPGIGSSAFDIPTGMAWVNNSSVWSLPAGNGSLYEGIGSAGALTFVDSVSVSARLVRLRPERLVERPLVAGTLWTGDGEQLSVEERDGRVELVWRTVGATSEREDRDALASGSRPLDRRYAFVVLDSARRTAELMNTGNTRGAAIPLTLLLLEGRVTRMPLPRGTSIVVYRWVEDGHSRIERKWAVKAWPEKSEDRSTVVEFVR